MEVLSWYKITFSLPLLGKDLVVLLIKESGSRHDELRAMQAILIFHKSAKLGQTGSCRLFLSCVFDRTLSVARITLSSLCHIDGGNFLNIWILVI